MAQSFLTSTSTAHQMWTIPSDWNDGNNTVEGIGPGGTGSARQSSTLGGRGGGGGSYAKRANLALASQAGKSVGYILPAGGSAADLCFYDLNQAMNTNSVGSSPWGLLAGSNATGATDSQGGSNASTFTEDATTNTHGYYQLLNGKPASTQITYGFYIEMLTLNSTRYVLTGIQSADNADAGFAVWDILNGVYVTNLNQGVGTLDDHVITSLGGGWYSLFAVTSFTNAETGTGYHPVIYRSDASGGTSLAGTNAATFRVGRPIVTVGNALRPYNANTSTTAALWSLLAKGGTNATTAVNGAGQSGSVGDTTFQGGNGAANSSGDGGGGGGAAGPSGAGGNGVAGGAGGTANNGTTAGGAANSPGNAGTEFDGSHGSGSGGGGTSDVAATNGRAGGNYGGGGSGCDDTSAATGGTGGAPLIILNYTPPAAAALRQPQPLMHLLAR